MQLTKIYRPGEGIEGCADASDLDLPPGMVLKTLFVQHEDKEVAYHMTDLFKDREGDYWYWVYAPINWDMGMMPFPRTITIYND